MDFRADLDTNIMEQKHSDRYWLIMLYVHNIYINTLFMDTDICVIDQYQPIISAAPFISGALECTVQTEIGSS